MTARFAPGPWLAIARPACWALVELSADDPRLAAVQRAASADDPVAAILDVMLADGLRSMPGFALVARTGTSLRYAVRHPAALQLDDVAIEPAAGTSWTDAVLAGLPAGATLLAGGAAYGGDPAERPLEPGVTAAGRVRVSWSAEEISQSAVPTAPSAPGLIDGVPWVSAASAWPSDASEASGPPPPTGPLPQGPAQAPHDAPRYDAPHDAPRYDAPPNDAPGATHLRGATGGDRTVQRPSAAPMVWAARCTQGHLTSPYSPMCRVCATPVPEQQPVQVPRPVLGRLVLSTGGSITLDRTVVLGRSPQAPAGEEGAQLVRLTTATEVSRSHAEVRLEDWHVFLRDLGSANGTLLTLPGHEPQQLRPNEDHHLEHGSTVSLADVVGFRYEVTA